MVFTGCRSNKFHLIDFLQYVKQKIESLDKTENEIGGVILTQRESSGKIPCFPCVESYIISRLWELGTAIN